MAEETKQEGLTKEELEAQTGEQLPDREAMSVVWIEPDPMPGGAEPPPDTVKGYPVDYSIDQDSGDRPEPLKGGESA